ncbi:MAG: hypothetical protein ACPGXY_06505 [Alphaproteobacteria bacterium]
MEHENNKNKTVENTLQKNPLIIYCEDKKTYMRYIIILMLVTALPPLLAFKEPPEEVKAYFLSRDGEQIIAAECPKVTKIAPKLRTYGVKSFSLQSSHKQHCLRLILESEGNPLIEVSSARISNLENQALRQIVFTAKGTNSTAFILNAPLSCLDLYDALLEGNLCFK